MVAMKLIPMPQLVLVLVLGLSGALARKPNNQQEAPVVTEGLFGTGSLEQIEASIMSLAQTTTADNSTLESLALIQAFLDQMKQEVRDRANATQCGVFDSWQRLENCKLNLTLDPKDNLTDLNRSHRECSDQESALLNGERICIANCGEMCETAQASCDQYCPINIPQPLPALPVPSPTPSPTSCWYDQTQLKSTSQEGIYHEWESNMYYKKFEDAFGSLFDNWKAKRDDCNAKVSEMTKCYDSCSSQVNASSWEAKKQECTDHQYDLEAAACRDTGRYCLGYQACHRSLTHIYEEDVGAANASQTVWYDEYRGIMRIECLIEAFTSSIVDGTDLTSGLDACQTKIFYPCTEQPVLCLEFYPVPAEVNCSASNISEIQPGTETWLGLYYENMAPGTTYEECGSSCCSTDSMTTTTSSTLPAIIHNCSLCCSDSDSFCRVD